MKKVAIGCGIVAVILILALIGGGFWLVRSARQYIEGYAELAQVTELNQRVENRSAYRPPADQRLTAVQVTQYVTVQRAMLDQLGNRVRQLEGKYSQLNANLEEQGRDANLLEVLAAWRDVVSLIVTAKESQVTALNSVGLSLEEYHWIRQQVLMALGYGLFGFNLEAVAQNPENLLDALEAPDSPEIATLQHNRALLQEYEDSYEEWLPLSFFGL